MVCCICGKEFEGFGNDPYPVKQTGRCCNDCNTMYVVEARLDKLLNGVEDGYKQDKQG